MGKIKVYKFSENVIPITPELVLVFGSRKSATIMPIRQYVSEVVNASMDSPKILNLGYQFLHSLMARPGAGAGGGEVIQWLPPQKSGGSTIQRMRVT